MEWFLIAGLIILGILFLIAEIIFVPGTTIVGILGVASMGYGIYETYNSYGNTVGTVTLIGTSLVTILALYRSFKSGAWDRFSLKQSMQGKVNEGQRKIIVGTKGITLSSLKPVGKALFENDELEVRSNGEFVSENVEIEVLRIEGNKIIIQPTK